ncbi:MULTISPECIES: glycosyltransferase family 9 protein [Bradyrhizobium]|jgi:Tfp pilus assembly protein PilF|uniref:tetratricopeptide repeat-containing glycosyltransferase family protein n=1 Tax=Bradyrhizobium TaxID=374 RepID=UPI00115FBE48|nr:MULTISPECIES: tetratricopeptide repeat-containing glycosyltransferase family protein [Bradyrhizobium]
MQEHALSPSCDEGSHPPHTPAGEEVVEALRERSPSLHREDDGKPPKPLIAGDASRGPQTGALTRLTAASPMPAQPPMPKVPVPLDELLKVAAEFSEGGRFSEAERILGHILSAAPNEPMALHQKGVLLFRMGHHEAAAEMIERSIGLAPDAIVFRRNLCPILERLGRYDDALRVGYQAFDRDPYDLQTLHNLAIAHYRKLELDQSIACARRALAVDPAAPGPHFQLAEALLLRGEFAEGLKEYEWRFRIAGAAPLLPPNKRPQWDGAPLPGATLLLIADQGFGDSIQFCRYIPWVCARCPRVVVVADPLMHPVIRQIHPALEVVGHWDQCPPFDTYCPLSGLPRLHGTTLDTIPSKAPYLHADPARTAAWRARLQDLIQPGIRRVGMVWAGRPTHNNDLNRSMSLAAWAPIAALGGITLVSLQKGSEQNAIADYFGRAPLLNLGAAIADFADTMAIIETLDLVVTVDTAVAHLAGAMGKPVWILLPYAPDWRWLLERSDSPWYPTARLFRQPSPGDWASVVCRVGEALSEPRLQAQRREKPCNQLCPDAPLLQGGRSAPDRASRAKRRKRIKTEISGGLHR